MFKNNSLCQLAEKCELSTAEKFRFFGCGLDIIESHPLMFYDENLKHNCSIVLTHFQQASDILQFIMSAMQKKEDDLLYTLSPNRTTPLLESDYILNKLTNLQLIKNFYFNPMANSFRIQLSKHSIDLYSILSIGLYSKLKAVGTDIILFDTTFKKNGVTIQTHISCIKDNKVFLYQFNLSGGLEKNWNSHLSQQKKLQNEIINSNFFDNSNTNIYFIVTSHCKAIFPPHEKVISLDELLLGLN